MTKSQDKKPVDSHHIPVSWSICSIVVWSLPNGCSVTGSHHSSLSSIAVNTLNADIRSTSSGLSDPGLELTVDLSRVHLVW